MNLKTIIPSGPQVAQEVIVQLAAVLIVAFILSRFPGLQKFVTDSSLTVKRDDGQIMF